MNPAAFRRHFGTAAPDVTGGARLAALRLTVRDLKDAGTTLNTGGIAHATVMNRIVVAPGQAMGATLVFEE
jgi:hypothetical protein